jgi:hypothetical protein
MFLAEPCCQASSDIQDRVLSFSTISLPSGVLVFTSSDLLLLLSCVKYSASKSVRAVFPEAGRPTASIMTGT